MIIIAGGLTATPVSPSKKSINFRVAYWFSLPFAYKRKRECEVSPPAGEVARSAGGVSLAQHMTACYKRDVMFCAKLTTEQSPHTLRADAQSLRAVARLNAKKR